MVPLLRVRNVCKNFTRRSWMPGRSVLTKALLGVSFEVCRGEILGIVGESGCGKSTLARTLVGLVEPENGEAILGSRTLFAADRRSLPPGKRGIQIVFQDPYASLNPRMSVGQIVAEGLRIRGERRHDWEPKTRRMLELVGLKAEDAVRYPGQFSGGQRQRIAIARALVLAPDLLIADEAVSALDVSVQLQILNLLLSIRDELGLTILFITHDLAVADYLCDRLLVMYRGEVIEEGPTSEIIDNPRMGYTARLIASVPRL